MRPKEKKKSQREKSETDMEVERKPQQSEFSLAELESRIGFKGASVLKIVGYGNQPR